MTLDKWWLIFRDHLKAGEPQGTIGGIQRQQAKWRLGGGRVSQAGSVFLLPAIGFFFHC